MADVKSPVETQFRNPYDSDDALKVDVVNAKDVKQEEELGGKKPKKSHKRFFFWILPRKKWWYAFWATVVAVLLILFLITWFVIIKAIFQAFANKVKLSVNYLDIKSIDKTEDVSSMGVEMSLNFRHDLSLSSSTDETTARLLFDGDEFGTIQFPALDLNSGDQDYNITIVGDLTVTDREVFEKMSTAIVTNATVDMAAHAKVTAHGLGLTRSGIKFNRDLTVKGLNNFKDPLTTIEYMDMKAKKCDDDNYYILLNNTVTNVGQMGMPGIGALNLSVYYNEDYLGYIISQNETLGVPRGVSEPQFMMTIAKSNSAMKTMVSQMLASEPIQYYVRGDNPYTTKIGLLQESLTYLNMHINYTAGIANVGLDASCAASLLT